MELLIENHARWIDLANKQREKVKSSSFSIQTVPSEADKISMS
ncbi:hypothetical protein [Paralysiella testudinis]|mgnify:FL=1|nr:hypothetical protein [Paralysiella testudinis]